MGVLCDSSIPSQCNVYHDSFCIIDDRSCASFSTRRRSAYFSGHVHHTSHQWSPQENGEKSKILERSKKAELKSDGTLSLSDETTIRRWPASCGARNRKSENPTLIHQPRHGARKQPLDELAPEDACDTDGKPVSKLASLGDDHPATQANPGEEPIKDQGIAKSHQEEQKLSFYALEDNTNAADVPLPPSPPPLPLKDHHKRREQILASVAGRLVKRPRDDNHEDVPQISVHFKRVMRYSQKVTVHVQQPDAKTTLCAVSAEPRDSLPRFEVSRWLNIDWQSLTSTSLDFPWDSHDDVQVPLNISTIDSAAIPPAPFSLISITQPVLGEIHTNTDSFVPAIRKFNELIESCNASARYAENANLCLANNRSGTRCGSAFGLRVEDRPIVGKLLTELTGLDFNSNSSSCVHKLLTFTNLAVCQYQRKSIREKVAGLRQRQVERINDKDCVKYLPQLLPYRPPESANLRANEFVLQQAIEPFTVNYDPKKALGEGYLYVYWNEATFGVRKIGFTTYEVSDRLRQWEADCKHAAVEQYSSPGKVRHAARVEQLVHADLLDYRVREPACRTCLKSHIEWFRGVDLPYIIRRIEAWSLWVSEEPYEQVGRQWRLTSKGREKMPMVTDPISSRNPEVPTKHPANDSRRCKSRSTRRTMRAKGRHGFVVEEQKLPSYANILNYKDAILPSLVPTLM